MPHKSLFSSRRASSSRATQAKALADRVLSFSKADETRVNIASGWTRQHALRRRRDHDVAAAPPTRSSPSRRTVGKRRASAHDQRARRREPASAPSISPSVSRSLRPDDPELMPELGPQQYATVNGYFDDDREPLRRRARAAAKKSSDRRGRSGAGKAAGDIVRRRISRGERRRDGRREQQRPVRLSPHRRRAISATRRARRTPPAPAGRAAARATGALIDPASLGRVARAEGGGQSQSRRRSSRDCTRWCSNRRRSRSSCRRSPARSTRAAHDEGRSTFSKPGGGTKLGEKIVDERVTIYSDPADPDLLGAAVRRRRHFRSAASSGSRTAC